MKVIPLSDQVLLKPVKKQQVSHGGIVLPDSANMRVVSMARVIAVGPGSYLENGSRREVEFKAGQLVMFNGYGEDVEIEGERHQICSQDSIRAIVED